MWAARNFVELDVRTIGGASNIAAVVDMPKVALQVGHWHPMGWIQTFGGEQQG